MKKIIAKIVSFFKFQFLKKSYSKTFFRWIKQNEAIGIRVKNETDSAIKDIELLNPFNTSLNETKGIKKELIYPKDITFNQLTELLKQTPLKIESFRHRTEADKYNIYRQIEEPLYLMEILPNGNIFTKCCVPRIDSYQFDNSTAGTFTVDGEDLDQYTSIKLSVLHPKSEYALHIFIYKKRELSKTFTYWFWQKGYWKLVFKKDKSN